MEKILYQKGVMRVNKYGARKVTAPDGTVFDSQKEYNRWCNLRLLERAGKISGLKRQVKYELIPKQDGERACTYVADFVYQVPIAKQYINDNGHIVFADGYETVVEDCKGYRTESYKIKRKLMLCLYGIKIKET